MKCQILFSRKNKKNITNLSSAELACYSVFVDRLHKHPVLTLSMLGKHFSRRHFGLLLYFQ